MNSAFTRALSASLLLAFVLETLPAAHAQSASPGMPARSIEEYRRAALVREGNAARGKLLFADEQRAACSKCHTIDGKGGKAGPDLFAVGDQFGRGDIVTAILTPSASIAVGYSTTVVETKSGDEFQGVLKHVTDSEIELATADGRRVRIPAADVVKRQGSNLSLMPEGLHAGMTVEEFTDLIEYLASLRESSSVRSIHHGTPEVIPHLMQPVAVRPFFSEELRFPHSYVRAPGDVQTGLVWFEQVPGRKHDFLVVHQSGKIWLLEKNPDGDRKSVFLDVTPEVFSVRGPNGLLGLAFHPKFRENRKYYLKQQVFEENTITTLLVERVASDDFKKDSGRPPRRLLKIPAVAEHHNGGCIRFGPDGFLYFGMGDSAPNQDPQGLAQNPALFFGKMLRLDVDHAEEGKAYSIPSDNPFRGKPGVLPEIWASGFREPWRFSFDSLTGELWVGDLGQDRSDEVDVVRRGENFGWNVYEAFEGFSNGYRKPDAQYVPPLFATKRRNGVALMGGLVYRGESRSPFYGVYVFGDFNSKRIWGLTQENRSLKTIRQIAMSPQPISAFTADEEGNVYVTGYEGMVYRLDFTGAQFERSHRFACADYSQGKVFVVDAGGRIEWDYPAPSCNELWALPNGNLLFSTGRGVKEVTPDKRVVFQYESKSEIYACQRLANGNTFIGECNTGRLLEVDPAGKVVKEIRLLPEGKDGGHLYIRNCRKLADGHYLVTHYGEQVVREYDSSGAVVRQIPAAGGPHSVVRLPNGNTLISCGDAVKDGARVFEADPSGKTVWEIRSRDLPGIDLKFMTGLQRLPNGNTVLSNWQGHGQFGSGPHLIEVTPDKKIVWIFDDHQRMKTVSSLQLLDVPGDATRGEVWH